MVSGYRWSQAHVSLYTFFRAACCSYSVPVYSGSVSIPCVIDVGVIIVVLLSLLSLHSMCYVVVVVVVVVVVMVVSLLSLLLKWFSEVDVAEVVDAV